MNERERAMRYSLIALGCLSLLFASGCTTLSESAHATPAEGITEKYWKLMELRGQPVPTLEQEPHLILKAQDGRVMGFAGCNSFTGTYTLDAAKARINVGPLAMTRKFCSAGMDVERGFGEVLGQADSYSMSGGDLTLNRARMAPLARFEAVYLQ
jgi:heat shock protein HslJ